MDETFLDIANARKAELEEAMIQDDRLYNDLSNQLEEVNQRLRTNGMELRVLELKIKRHISDNQLCECGHAFIEHSKHHGINYTAGCCFRCKCKYFIQQNP